MKIGILTLPLHSNYGGLLQAWALQKTLAAMSHKVIIINRVNSRSNIPLWRKIAGKVKNKILICLGKRKRYIPVTVELKKYSEQNVLKFRQNRYLGISPDLKSNEELLNYIESQDFDAYIVGSDQVWRPQYTPNLMTYFLDFIKDNNKVKKIAYAVSFGVDNWEFSEEQTKQASELTNLFDLITVRESSGVGLVDRYLNCKATHVLDPTMLVDKEDYIELVSRPTCDLYQSGGDLFCYVLDKTQVVEDSIELCSSKTGYKPYYCNYITPLYKLKNGEPIENSLVPPVEQWLKSFNDAKMVITDSFHGCVFSIIFNKPFWVIPNKQRGSARFFSLLKQFELDNRIIKDGYKTDWRSGINWEKVNALRDSLSNNSKTLLNKFLNKNLNII